VVGLRLFLIGLDALLEGRALFWDLLLHWLLDDIVLKFEKLAIQRIGR